MDTDKTGRETTEDTEHTEMKISHPSPGGATDNSPAIHRWVGGCSGPSPDGTAEEPFTEANRDNGDKGKIFDRKIEDKNMGKRAIFLSPSISVPSVTSCSKSPPCIPLISWFKNFRALWCSCVAICFCSPSPLSALSAVKFHFVLLSLKVLASCANFPGASALSHLTHLTHLTLWLRLCRAG